MLSALAVDKIDALSLEALPFEPLCAEATQFDPRRRVACHRNRFDCGLGEAQCMIGEAPVIETDRLVMRGWRKDDLPRWYDILQDEDVTRFLGGSSGTKEDVWRRIAAGAGSWSLVGFGRWAVTMKETNKLVGDVGLFNAWRALEPQFGEEPEMGWVFTPEVQGCGIASEATVAALGWAEANLEPTTIWAIIAPENEASLRLASRLGFNPIGETRYHDEPTVVLERRAWA